MVCRTTSKIWIKTGTTQNLGENAELVVFLSHVEIWAENKYKTPAQQRDIFRPKLFYSNIKFEAQE